MADYQLAEELAFKRIWVFDPPPSLPVSVAVLCRVIGGLLRATPSFMALRREEYPVVGELRLSGQSFWGKWPISAAWTASCPSEGASFPYGTDRMNRRQKGR
jgi:hypothetical protein